MVTRTVRVHEIEDKDNGGMIRVSFCLYCDAECTAGCELCEDCAYRYRNRYGTTAWWDKWNNRETP